MPFTVPSLSTLIARAKSDINARLSGLEGFVDARLRRSLNFVLANVNAGAANGLYGFLSFIFEQVFPDTAEAEFLDRWASIWGVTRNQAVQATGTVTFTGTDPTNIPAGTEVQRDDGETFTVDVGGNLSGGTIDLAVTAVDAGADGNTAALIFVELVTPIPLVNSVATVAAGGLIDGVDADTDAQLLARLLARIQDPPQGGAEADYEAFVLDAGIGVDRVFVSALEDGAGTVTVRFTIPDTGTGVLNTPVLVIPSAGTRTAGVAAIEDGRPVTAVVTVPDPAIVADEITMTLSITPDTAAIRQAVKDQLDALWFRDAIPGGTVANSRIREAVSAATGEDSNVIADINGGGALADVVLAQTDVAVTGFLTFT